jgi:hypothetical protein
MCIIAQFLGDDFIIFESQIENISIFSLILIKYSLILQLIYPCKRVILKLFRKYLTCKNLFFRG